TRHFGADATEVAENPKCGNNQTRHAGLSGRLSQHASAFGVFGNFRRVCPKMARQALVTFFSLRLLPPPSSTVSPFLLLVYLERSIVIVIKYDYGGKRPKKGPL